VLGERERFVDAQPSAPQDDDHRAQAATVTVIRGLAHETATISSTVGGLPDTAFPCCEAAGRRDSRSA
jgi:hypothetical protein